MAQVFPLNPDESHLDEAQRALAATLSGLPTDWTLLRDRQFGEEPVDGVLIHPGIGIALVCLAPRDAAAAAVLLREQLARERFSEFFPGELPIVTLSLAAEEIPEVGERLAAAFEALPPLDIADKDWGDGVIELLLVPSDVSMIPTGGIEGIGAGPRGMPAGEAMPASAAAVAASFTAPREPRDGLEEAPARPQRDDWERPFALRADTPAIFELEPLRQRRWLPAAAAAAAVLLAALGLAAWGFGDSDSDGGARTPAAQALIDIPRPPSAKPAGTPPATAQEPPAVPPAPPVMMAAKPLAAPPPAAPHPTQVAALPPPKPPVVMAQRPLAEGPPAPPRPTAVAPLPEPAPAVATATPPPAPTPPPAAHSEPARAQPVREAANGGSAAPARLKSRPAPEKRRVAKSEPNEAPQQLMQREIEARQDRPPVDAADLPPLEQTAPAAPPAVAAPAPTAPSAPMVGPPVQLVRSPAGGTVAVGGGNAVPVQAAATAAPAVQRECRPYTSDTTLSGRSLRVEGIACRGPDGQWRLVSEAPLR